MSNPPAKSDGSPLLSHVRRPPSHLALVSPPHVPHTPTARQPASPTTLTSTGMGPVPLLQSTTLREDDGLSAVREIWERNCDTLQPQQQEELWQVPSEFKDFVF